MRNIFLFLLVVNLTACSSMNSSFDCPNQAGVMCKSLDQINGMVDKGQIRGTTQEIPSTKVNAANRPFEPYSLVDHSKATPLRQGETVQRVWIAPFEDTEGNYHEENRIYTVIKSGEWIKPSA